MHVISQDQGLRQTDFLQDETQEQALPAEDKGSPVSPYENTWLQLAARLPDSPYIYPA